MHRLFVALRPPRAMREQLLDAMGGVPGARWQSDDQLHLTLSFIGDVDRPLADDIAACLTAIDRPRPAIALRGRAASTIRATSTACGRGSRRTRR